MTPQESLEFLKPAFLDLFNRKPDLARFLRLAIDVFDPDPGYGPMRCKGDGMILPAGCGELTVFRVASLDGVPYGYQCTQCGCVFPYSLTKSSSFKKAPSRITLTSDGSDTIGHCKAETESGVSFTDAFDPEQSTPTWDTGKHKIVVDSPSRTYLTSEAARKEIPPESERTKIAKLLGVPESQVHALNWSPEEAAQIIADRKAPPVDRSAQTLTDGSPVTEDHREINPATGMQKGYVVLSAEERAKGFVRPVRDTYRHVGAPGPKYELRDLTEEENSRYSKYGYVKYEAYPQSNSSVTGKFWTQPMLDNIRKGCGTVTTMGRAIAETYARDNTFYGATMCVHCRKHLPLEEFVWEGTNERVGS
jgi:hypothetical protein